MNTTAQVLAAYAALAPAIEIIPEADTTTEHWSRIILHDLAAGNGEMSMRNINEFIDDLEMLAGEGDGAAYEEAMETIRTVRGMV